MLEGRLDRSTLDSLLPDKNSLVTGPEEPHFPRLPSG